MRQLTDEQMIEIGRARERFGAWYRKIHPYDLPPEEPPKPQSKVYTITRVTIDRTSLNHDRRIKQLEILAFLLAAILVLIEYIATFLRGSNDEET